MKLIHDEEKDFYLSQARLYLDELTDKDLYVQMMIVVFTILL